MAAPAIPVSEVPPLQPEPAAGAVSILETPPPAASSPQGIQGPTGAVGPPGAPAEPLIPPAPLVVDTRPDSITLTRRELDERISLAAAQQVAQRIAEEKRRMADDDQTKTTAEIAKLQQQLAAQQAQIETSLKTIQETADKLAAAEKARGEAEDQAKKAKRRAKERVVEATLKSEAAQAGIEDQDYALVLYAREHQRAMSQDPPGQPPESRQFFAGLKKTNPGIFKPDAQPVPATTAPATGQDGQPAPTPATAGSGAAGPPVDIDKLNPVDFANHTRNKYGFNPGVF